jgi:hypothetical protein
MGIQATILVSYEISRSVEGIEVDGVPLGASPVPWPSSVSYPTRSLFLATKIADLSYRNNGETLAE